MKSKTTAAILAFFLGGIGVHRFYLGKIGEGFIYLIFCFTFIPALVAFIDFIIFLTMDENAFNLKYNGGAVSNVAVSVGSESVNVAEEIEKLHNLKEKGIITEAEFTNKKAKLL